jgi:Rrf2 family protein
MRLNVTSKGRYALRVMLDLAQHPDDGFVSLKTIAERQSISMKYLESIVCSLKKAGLVESSRGKEGGYSLSRAPEDYPVGEILRSTEDKLAPVACITAEGVACEQASACLTLPMWRELDELTNRYLDTVSLRDLLTGDKWKNEKTFTIQKGT